MRRFLGIVGLSLVAGCASDGMQEKLRDATRGYNGAIRWGDMDRAAEYLPADSQKAFLTRMEKAEDKLVIVDYEVTRLDLDKELGVAASRAEISWHTDRRLILETTHIDHLWQFHEGRFVLVDERRASGKPLGVFAESDDIVHPWLPGLAQYREVNEIGKEHKKGSKRKRRNKKKSGDQTASRR